MATSVATRASSKQPQGSSTEPSEVRLMKALTKLWLRTRHTADQEAQREAIFSLWLKDLSHWSISQTIPVLIQLATTEEWWPAWATVVKQLPTPDKAIGYENPWAPIKNASVRMWADRVVRAYLNVYDRKAADRDRRTLIDQATKIVLNTGEGRLGLPPGPYWDGEQCLRSAGRDRAS